MAQLWRRNWARVTPFFQYAPELRRAIYTTNGVEALHRSFRKIIKTRGAFPTEQSALKLLFLAIRQMSKKWTHAGDHWAEALTGIFHASAELPLPSLGAGYASEGDAVLRG